MSYDTARLLEMKPLSGILKSRGQSMACTRIENASNQSFAPALLCTYITVMTYKHLQRND